MRHHKHPGLAGYLNVLDQRVTIDAYPESSAPDAQLLWVPLSDKEGRSIDALEGLMAVPTRAGAMRLVSVPHVAENLAFGDEIAVGDWEGEPLARGVLASSLYGTIRVVAQSEETSWRSIAKLLQKTVSSVSQELRCVFDVISEESLAAAIPRTALPTVFGVLNQELEQERLSYEYVTALRH